MSNKKMIPCRVCKKLFEPCTTCQTHNNMFRWRNFACSRECAEKYIAETIAYRNSSKEGKNNSDSVIGNVVTAESNIVTVDNQEEKSITTKRKYNRKKSTNDVETINEEREQID
jgi:hypothetical protein